MSLLGPRSVQPGQTGRRFRQWACKGGAFRPLRVTGDRLRARRSHRAAWAPRLWSWLQGRETRNVANERG